MTNSSDDRWSSTLPADVAQNPSPNPETGQAVITERQALVDGITNTFMSLLPSNYVSQERGPWYTLQFSAIAEALATFQMSAQEVFKDNDWDFTRPDFLWEVLGTLVFPGADARSGIPQVDGDLEYRAFLKGMVLLLVQGATADVMAEGPELVTDADVNVLEKFLYALARRSDGAWTIDNQFEVEIDIEMSDGTRFPDAPITLQTNVRLIEEALKPAHVLYDYRYLFRDAFGTLFTDSASWTLDQYRYDDLRKDCFGAREITGTAGVTWADTSLFSDVTLSFKSVRDGAVLRLDTGTNAGTYTVTDVRYFPVGDDTTARAYTTSPTGLLGTATVSGQTITDTSQNWALAEEGEVLTFTAGPNAGSYRLDTLLGAGGGPLGTATGPATAVRVSPCLLRVKPRMAAAATSQAYILEADRLGFRVPRTVTGEDATEQFVL